MERAGRRGHDRNDDRKGKNVAQDEPGYQALSVRRVTSGARRRGLRRMFRHAPVVYKRLHRNLSSARIHVQGSRSMETFFPSLGERAW